MFKMIDTFVACDDNKQPYSLATERHTEIMDLHAAVDEHGFSLKSIGNRFVVNTPGLCHFDFSIKFFYTFMEEYDPTFHVLFGYDTKTRCGYGLRFIYRLGGGMEVSYIRLEKMKVTVLEMQQLQGFCIGEEEDAFLQLTYDGQTLSGELDGQTFSFAAEGICGKIALERKNFIGEFVIREFSVTSEDDFTETILLPEQTVDIPLLEGGDIPYRFTYSIKKINEVCYLETALGGGTATRPVNREDRPGQYVAELDTLTSPFVTVRGDGWEQKFNIFTGEKRICDPNLFWKCLKRFFGHPELPIRNRFVLKEAFAAEVQTISFGYKSLVCRGYISQAGGPSEFIFDKEGRLLYEGQALEESIFDLYSPDDKFATTLIPTNAYKHEEILHHLKTNHYFHKDEDISLTLSVKTKLKPEHFTVKAEICDVYESAVLKKFSPSFAVHEWQFGYKELCACVKSAALPVGVYRVVFTVFYGDGVYRRYNKVFEVFDAESHISPAQESGLPYVFSMPNEQKWLMRNSFDLWNPKPSCDVGHFISCVTDTPIEAETRRVWEVIKPFGREWFAWLSSRTCLDFSMESHPEVVANSDYLYVPAKTEVFPLRNDLYLVKTYQNPEFRKYLHEFLNEHPDIKEKLLYKEPEQEEVEYERAPIFDESGQIPIYKSFTYEHLKDLLDTCHAEWFRFVNKKLLENFREQNAEIKKLNPNFKRTAYGPFNNYITPTLSYHTIKAFGNLPYESLHDEVYTGFAIFEDYPASCAYQTYRGAFAVMTILLHCPKLVLYPEQYKSSVGGCIDGAVKFSHAPMGAYNLPYYFNTTHAFEFVFNTPHKTEEGYKYWTTYGFHRPDFSPALWDALVRDWKTVLDAKPEKPLRTMGMITEYYEEEDIYDDSIINFHGHTNLYNTSEEAHGYLYECVREGGLNAPFAMKFDALKSLTATECDVLVLPTLHYATDDAKAEIRHLHREGVALFAVSDVDGLEDIFGVVCRPEKKYIHTLFAANGEEEEIYPNEASFKYQANGAEVLLAADDGAPVLMKHGNAVLLNAAVSTLGHECFEGAAGKGC